MEILLVFFLSYLCGSIPFGLILTKLYSDKDIRKSGSGNIGATNVLRSGNKYLALLTLILDTFKGYIPVFITLQLYPQQIQIAALMVFLGHVFPIWLKFKGGKGVATYLGILFAVSIPLSILFIFTWLVIFLIFKYSSVSSLFATLTIFVITFLRELVQSIAEKINLNFNSENNQALLMFIFLILIIFTHKKNIFNLKNKTEKKIKF
jgi:acyl phosphate:glycerol-3-phosphate acyltransferase